MTIFTNKNIILFYANNYFKPLYLIWPIKYFIYIKDYKQVNDVIIVLDRNKYKMIKNLILTL